jgi:hypothetical protein
MANNETANAAAPKSTAELLVLARARVAKLEQRATTEAVLNGISAGDAVTFRFGRNIPERTNKAGETVPARAARILSGIVLGVQDVMGDDGQLANKIVKVQAGEGFDADTYKVNARDITSVGDAATEQDDDDLGVEEADAPASEELLDEGDPLDGAE